MSKRKPRPKGSSSAPSQQRVTPSVESPAARIDWSSLAAGSAVTIAAALLYGVTAARDIVTGDTPELAAAAVTLGVAHPPGYPLLTLLGHLFSQLPIDPVAFRLNLFASFCGAITVAFVYATGWELTRSRGAAAVASMALAISPLFWEWSLVFEAFALNNLMAAFLVYLVIRWERTLRPHYLLFGALVGGLGMANHQTIVLLAPAILFLMWRRRATLLARPAILLASAGAFLAGLAVYLTIPWAASRHPYMNWGEVSSLRDLLALAARTDYGTASLVANPQFQGGSPLARVIAFAESFTPLQMVLLFSGAVEAFRRARWYFWFSLLAYVLSGPGFVGYANLALSDPSTLFVLARFFLLAHVATAPLMAFGVCFLERHALSLARRGSAVMVRATRPALSVAAILVLVVPAAIALPRVDQSRNHIAGQYARDLLNGLPPRALVLAGGDEHVGPMAYMQAVEGLRPDVTVVMSPLLNGAWYLRHLKNHRSDLVIPFDTYDRQVPQRALKGLVDANRERPIVQIGQPVDESLKGSYGYIAAGLVNRIEPVTQQFDLGQVVAENERLLAQYHPPDPRVIRARSFEGTILTSYAAPAEWLGEQYENAGRPSLAQAWYQRALKIDPTYRLARGGLSRVASK
jgi:dolichyl-phosphate-mannose-protein mannosyltransferase